MSGQRTFAEADLLFLCLTLESPLAYSLQYSCRFSENRPWRTVTLTDDRTESNVDERVDSAGRKEGCVGA